MKNISSKKINPQRYNESKFMTTHNSYANTLDPNGSIAKQLDHGIRGLELDIHDKDIWKELIQGKTSTWDRFLSRFKIAIRFHFKIGHWWVGHQVSRLTGNPRGNSFQDWLGTIAKWSRENKGHAPITVFMDIKAGLHEEDNNPPEKRGLIRLNNQIREVFKEDFETRLFTLEDFKKYYKEHQDWPPIDELRNKIILVLMSFHYEHDPAIAVLPPKLREKGTFLGLPPMKTRITYKKGTISSKEIEQICFVAFNPEDHGKEGSDFLETESWFVTPHPPGNWNQYSDKGVIVRVNYRDGDDITYVNFPVTDHWRDENYQTATNWVT